MKQGTLFEDPTRLFNSELGQHEKERGLELAIKAHERMIEFAKRLAFFYGQRTPGFICHADIVQEELIRRGHDPSELGNAAGSIFSGDEWEFTGSWIPSSRISNHRRYIRVWRIAEKYRGKRLTL